MSRALNFSSGTLLAFSLALLCLGMAHGLSSGDEQQAQELRALETISSIGEVAKGKQLDVAIALENPTGRMITILGASRICCPQGCIMPEGFPVRIPAFAEKAVYLRFDVGERHGEFQIPVPFYTDRNGPGEFAIQLRGRVRP
jgi:hypothetical protein